MPKRSGRKSVAQTPAPKSDIIYGSKKNPKGSASSEKTAKSIKLSEKTEKVLKEKLSEFKEEHPNKKNVTLSDLKAVYRRGSGAYSKTHRPTITGGAPNSRAAWSYARVNKFLKKAGGEKVKAAYVQDDDLMAEGGLIASNGQKSNLTPEQYILVRTPEFKAWFGDWENDPENASKVVDENGEPLVVYHGAEIFNKKEKGLFYIFRPGSYFTDTYKSAEYYASKLAYGITDVKKEDTEIYSVFLNIKNPKTFDYSIDEAEDYFHDFDQYDKRIETYLSEGYDGIFWEYSFKMYDTSIKNKEKHFITFKPNQVKLADGNNTFDIDNQDIRYKDGGKLFNDRELLAKWKKGESIGFTGEAHLKAKGLIPRADVTKRKSEKYMANGGQTSQEVTCVNCGWKWNTSDSDKEDMYLCHQCGFDNTLYYSDIMSKLKKPMSVSEISQKHGVTTEYIENQLNIGLKHELEHTDDEGVARIIALHHIGEKPNYYELVEKYKLEEGGQPSKFWHQADEYEISDFIKKEKMATEELLCSADTRIAKAIICRGKIDFAELKEQKAHNLEEKNAWSAVKHIWEECLQDVKTGVVYEYKDGGECGCMSYKDGGLAYGNSHDKGGMPLKVMSTGQNIEIEGGEGVINKRSMQMNKKLDFQGKMLTPCQIVSKINEMGGGVKFKCQDVAEIIAKDGNF